MRIAPALVSKARELRDRYLERVNDRLLLSTASGKYEVSRSLAVNERAVPMLKAG